MIQISGIPLNPNEVGVSDHLEQVIIQRMALDPAVHSYRSTGEFMFEMRFRKNIMMSAKAMQESQATFETFSNSRCNVKYWIRMNNGGFRLRRDSRPSEAIRDIYVNSHLYGFECATAMVIILYHAALQVLGEPLFNRLFTPIYLYSWNFDPDLGLRNVHTRYFLPGDIVYFNNPDFHPHYSQWRGVNAVVLEDGRYFGHGMGIKTAEQMIRSLNDYRRPGSTQSAYLLNTVTRPNFTRLAYLSITHPREWLEKHLFFIVHHNEDSISFEKYMFYVTNSSTS